MDPEIEITLKKGKKNIEIRELHRREFDVGGDARRDGAGLADVRRRNVARLFGESRLD